MKTVHFNDEVQIKYFSKDKPIMKNRINSKKQRNLKTILLIVICIIFLFIIG